MSIMSQEDPAPTETPPTGKASRREDLNNVRQIPRISIQAFCETDMVAHILDGAAADRRMMRAHFKLHTGGLPAAIELYRDAPTPNLIVVETGQAREKLLEELRKLAEVCDGETRVIVIGQQNDIALYRELMANGVSEYLVSPVSMAEFMNAVSGIFIDPEAGPIGKTFAFIGAKGGSGSSTICHNTAWAIASLYQHDVVLTDLDLAFGTANINLDQDPPQGIAEALFSPERIDEMLLDRLLTKCAEHLSLLAAPSTLDRTYDFEKDTFTTILEVAQRGTPCVVVDLPHQWNGWTKQILASADAVVITACPELANLRNTKNLLDILTDLRPNDTKPYLVMNQVGMPRRPEIGVGDFVAPLDISPSAVIPFDPALFGAASNNGQMIGEADPKNPVANIFDQICRLLIGKTPVSMEKKSPLDLLSRLRIKSG
jgi:pilus assembly protein CpaE